MSAPAPHPPRVYTVGHSNRGLTEFVDTLREAGVEVLADVRSWPKSRFPHFTADNLQPALLDRGIHYVHLPGLGGRRERDYEAWMRTSVWRADFGALKALACAGPTAIMCAEREPEGCHRLHIARALLRDGWRVTHLIAPGESREMRPQKAVQARLDRFQGARLAERHKE